MSTEQLIGVQQVALYYDFTTSSGAIRTGVGRAVLFSPAGGDMRMYT